MQANAANSVPERNMVLIGFMGAGKTTVGKIVADRLTREFIDVDELIASERGMPVTEIFKTMGEAAFRRMEKEYIKDLCENKRCAVLSLGGGAFLQEEIREICLSSADVVFLDIPWESWKTRLPLIRDSRPILQNKSDDEVKALYDARQAIYAQHHFKVNAGHRTPEEAAQDLIDWLTTQQRI